VGLVSSLSGRDPAAVYGAFGVVVSVLLVLATFFAARGVLTWSRPRAFAAAALVAGNAYLLFSAFYGWQGQLALTAFGLASICCFRVALEPGAPARMQLAAALFTAAAIATYGPTYGPFAGLLAAVAVGFLLTVGPTRVAARRILGVAARTAAFTILIGAEPLLRAALYLPDFLSFLDLAWLEAFGYARSLPADAIGLVPRTTALQAPGSPWTMLAMLAALPFLAVGLLAAVRSRRPRSDLLVSTSVMLLVALTLLQLPIFSSYLSMKVASYGAPLLSMLVVLGFGRIGLRWPGLAVFAPAVGLGVALFGASTAISITQGVKSVHSSTAISGLEVAARDLPAGAVLIDVEDAWRQVWSVYYLRDRQLVVRRPTGFLTDFGTRDDGRPSSQDYAYQLTAGRDADALWRGEGLVLVRRRAGTPATLSASIAAGRPLEGRAGEPGP